MRPRTRTQCLPTPIVVPGWSPVWSFLRRFFELPAKSFTERREYAELNTGIQFQLNKQIKLGFRVVFRERRDGCRSVLPNYLRFGVKPESCTPQSMLAHSRLNKYAHQRSVCCLGRRGPRFCVCCTSTPTTRMISACSVVVLPSAALRRL